MASSWYAGCTKLRYTAINAFELKLEPEIASKFAVSSTNSNQICLFLMCPQPATKSQAEVFPCPKPRIRAAAAWGYCPVFHPPPALPSIVPKRERDSLTCRNFHISPLSLSPFSLSLPKWRRDLFPPLIGARQQGFLCREICAFWCEPRWFQNTWVAKLGKVCFANKNSQKSAKSMVEVEVVEVMNQWYLDPSPLHFTGR